MAQAHSLFFQVSVCFGDRKGWWNSCHIMSVIVTQVLISWARGKRKKWPVRFSILLSLCLRQGYGYLIYVWIFLGCLWISNTLRYVKRCACHSLSCNTPQPASSTEFQWDRADLLPSGNGAPQKLSSAFCPMICYNIIPTAWSLLTNIEYRAGFPPLFTLGLSISQVTSREESF